MKKSAYLVMTAAMVATSAFAGGYGGPGGSVSGIAEREMARRAARVQEAQASIERGDKLMAEGDCEGALNEYKSALDLIPDAPMTVALRDQVNVKYCEAAVCLAKERADNGRYADAKALLNDAIARHPDCEKAKKLLLQLDDPERYEPALTPEHVKNVEDATRNLQLAYSYLNIGDYDKANATFQSVLRIDPYNSAARRGMEQVELKRQGYFDTARDHQRSRMLNEVNKAWEDQVPIAFVQNPNDVYGNGPPDGSRYYTDKMQNIIFPTVEFEGASLEEAIEFLRIKSRDYDTVERDPAKRGVNLILRPGATPSTAQISLSLKDVPMSEALRYITELANMKYKVEPYAVVVVPITDVSSEQYTRTFLVPPDFVTGAATDSGGGASAPADPFASGGGAATTSLAGRGNAKDVLIAQGISFPEGASATFVAATSQLIVRNTQPNLDSIEAFVDSLRKKLPQQIYITTKFVEVTQKNTDELGFDWLLGQFNIDGGARTFGSGGTSGNSFNGTTNPVDYPFTQNGTVIGGTPVTAGNRNGTAAITPDSIDGLLTGAAAAAGVSPGIFALAGVFTDPQFQVVIRALSQKKGVDLMSAPSVTVKSGNHATIEVIREFMYPTEFDPPQIPQQFGATSTVGGLGGGSSASFPVTPTTPTTFDMRPVGVRMEVDPVVGPDGYTIDLSLAPEVTEFEGFINYGSPIQTSATDALGNPTTVTLTENRIEQPIFSTRKVVTNVTIWDGQTVAMGGLIREDVQDVEDKVPLLGDIPILGRLFQSKAEDHFKRNLMIFVTAKLIDPSGQPVFRQQAPTPGVTTSTVSADGGAGVLPAINP